MISLACAGEQVGGNRVPLQWRARLHDGRAADGRAVRVGVGKVFFCGARDDVADVPAVACRLRAVPLHRLPLAGQPWGEPGARV